MKLTSHAAPWLAAAAITCTAVTCTAMLVPTVALASVGSPGRGAAETGANCTWVVTALPELAGSNGQGEVLGTDGGSRFVGWSGDDAALWRDRQLTDLGPGMADAVNRAGVIVGTNSDTVTRAVLWRGQGATPVKLAVPAGVTSSVAVGINDSGMIVGFGSGALVPEEGLVWSARAPQRVQAIHSPGGGVLQVSGVSDTGLIVGGGFAGTLRSGMHPLPPASSSSATATAGRYIVGYDAAGPVLWVNGSPRSMPRLGAVPLAVNRYGEAGGVDFTSFGPVVWLRGAMIALPSPGGSGEVKAVTDSGELGGSIGNGVGPVTWTCR